MVNAYLLRQMRSYLHRLEEGLRAKGVIAPLLVMTSNGGMIAASTASEKPVLVVASGPAGGVVRGSRLAHARGDKDTIVFDMGGTTAKAAHHQRFGDGCLLVQLRIAKMVDTTPDHKIRQVAGVETD